MPDVEITRKQIIVVGEVGTNSYGDLTWTDKEGKSYKVGVKRKQYFEAIVPGQAVEIGFSTYRGREYPYSVRAVKDLLPATPPINPKVEALEEEQVAKAKPSKMEMSKDDWAEKDRITRKSIERQKSLELAVNLCIADKIPIDKVGEWVKKFEAYLEGYSLVEEAKKLIKKGEEDGQIKRL